jgi:uncharacterized surface protein with fasciclin (FAS1) repeats
VSSVSNICSFGHAAAAALLGPGKTGRNLVEALDVATLTAGLTSRVFAGDICARDVVSAGRLKTLDGNSAEVSVRNGEAFMDGARTLKTDIVASNGIIHVPGAVMLPF